MDPQLSNRWVWGEAEAELRKVQRRGGHIFLKDPRPAHEQPNKHFEYIFFSPQGKIWHWKLA